MHDSRPEDSRSDFALDCSSASRQAVSHQSVRTSNRVVWGLPEKGMLGGRTKGERLLWMLAGEDEGERGGRSRPRQTLSPPERVTARSQTRHTWLGH